MFRARLVTGDRTAMGPGEARLFTQGEPLAPTSGRESRGGRRTGWGPELNGSFTGLMSPAKESKSISADRQKLLENMIQSNAIKTTKG